MSKDETFKKVEKALSDGALWKAKEILQGNISQGYDYEIYEKYGQVLLQMGDLIEAGKYLFLSGKTLPHYEEPISLYLKRYSKSDPFIIFRTFPSAARLQQLSDYPKPVEDFLRSIGHSDKTIKNYPSQEFKQIRFSSVKGIFILILVVFIISVTGHSIWSLVSNLIKLFLVR